MKTLSLLPLAIILLTLSGTVVARDIFGLPLLAAPGPLDTTDPTSLPPIPSITIDHPFDHSFDPSIAPTSIPALPPITIDLSFASIGPNSSEQP